MNKYPVYITTYNRVDSQFTYKSLRAHGHTGPIRMVVDTSDPQLEEYREKYHGRDGVEVVVFDKMDYADKVDTYDNFTDMRAVIWARRACYDLALERGERWFIEMDDDYNSFLYRMDKDGNWASNKIRDLDAVFDVFMEFLQNTPANVISFCQEGDFIGGPETNPIAASILLRRKSMNVFFLDAENPVDFTGRMNDDVNMYINLNQRGGISFTHSGVSISPAQTQALDGGMTEHYKQTGTYQKTFYSIISQPAGVKISVVGPTQPRIHHAVTWNAIAPKILRESTRKV